MNQTVWPASSLGHLVPFADSSGPHAPSSIVPVPCVRHLTGSSCLLLFLSHLGSGLATFITGWEANAKAVAHRLHIPTAPDRLCARAKHAESSLPEAESSVIWAVFSSERRLTSH